MSSLDQLQLDLPSTRVLTEHLTDSVIFTDRNFSVVYLNKAAQKTFEVNLEEVKGCLIEDVIVFESIADERRKQILQSLRESNQWSGDASIMQKDGKCLVLRVNMCLIRNEKGRVENILIVCANLTDTNKVLELVSFLMNKNAELETAIRGLQQVQVQFESFMQHVPAPAWIVDEDGNHLFVNSLWWKTFGVNQHMLHFSLFDVFPEEIANEYLENNRRVLVANTAIEILEPCVLPSGERKLSKVCKFPINGPNGEKWVGGLSIDITDQVERQEQLQASNERYRQVIKATSDAIWDWDVIADQVHRGEGFKKLFGADLGTAPMELRNSFIHPEDRERMARSLQQALDSGAGHWQEEYRFLCLNGNYKICVDRANIIRDRQGNPTRMIGAMQDVTRQRELENELRRKELLRRQAISKAVIDAQEKERFEISFELHEQISQTLTTCNLLLHDLNCGEGKEQLEFCRNLLGQSINNIRNISHRINPGMLSMIGMIGALENLIYNIGKDDKLVIELVTSGLEDASAHLSEGLQLAAYRVVQEQLNNIRKHAAATNVRIVLQSKDRKFLIEIEDNGKGFNPQGLNRGLGLANIQHRAELHQGEMSIHSIPEKGTILRVEFPIELKGSKTAATIN